MRTRREFLGALAATGSVMGLNPIICATLRKLRPGDASEVVPTSETLIRFAASEMVGRVTENDAVVNLVAAANLDTPVAVRILWAEHPDDLVTAQHVSPVYVATQPLERIELDITGLHPNRQYYYRVQCQTSVNSGAWMHGSQVGEFRSQKTIGQGFSFCVVADPHWGALRRVPVNGPRYWTGQQCLQHILQDGDLDFCIDLGDSPFPTPARSVEETLAKYGEYRRIMADVTRKMPVYLVLGNHEQEAGYYQRGPNERPAPVPTNHLGSTQYYQKWSTEGRLRFIPNPRGDTYPEGGESAPGYDTAAEWGAGQDPWNDGARSHLQNFYAWTWGDALFVVLDPFRYTLVESTTVTNSPSQWTLGPTQMRWLKGLLADSTAKWKFVVSHHQVGGGLIGLRGGSVEDGGTEHAYGRGSAVEADRPGTEQAVIHRMMRHHGVQFFLYGHDHAFCHSVKDNVNYICCGRPTYLNKWLRGEGMKDSYGDLLVQGRDKPWIKALYNVLGYTKFHITPDTVTMEWIRTGFSFPKEVVPVAEAQRDWSESWFGRSYPVSSPSMVRVSTNPTDVDGIRTVAGARVANLFERPPGSDFYAHGGPSRPEDYAGPDVPMAAFPESLAAVDTVPELIYRRVWALGGDAHGVPDVDIADASRRRPVRMVAAVAPGSQA